MPFEQVTWKDRVSQYPNRRKLTGDVLNGTVTVERDEGTISEAGTAFSATNMNGLEARIAQTTRNIEKTLSVSQWSGEAPFTQSLVVEEMKETDVPIICKGTPLEKSSEKYKELTKNFAMIDEATVTEGQIEFKCYSKKPTADIPIIIRSL